MSPSNLPESQNTTGAKGSMAQEISIVINIAERIIGRLDNSGISKEIEAMGREIAALDNRMNGIIGHTSKPNGRGLTKGFGMPGAFPRISEERMLDGSLIARFSGS